MTIQELKEKKLIILECISGSRAYGLATPESDTDIKGVYILPKEEFYQLEKVEQVNNETNDIVYYELRKFMELLARNNPNILELLATPKDCILYKHPLMELIQANDFLSKECKNSFGSYAMTQIKKAKGLKKKIVNPIDKERKTVLDFCYVSHKQGAIPAQKFLQLQGIKQENCGLSKIPHMHEVYGLYYSENENYKGLAKHKEVHDISLSSISKGEEPIAVMSFNKTGYSKYCKDYKEYWQWVDKRNNERYANTIENGRNYDAKNMMHTFRLLNMAKEIGESGNINVIRPERDFLLAIRKGGYEYQELQSKAELLMHEVEQLFNKSDLPDNIDIEKVNNLLVQIRNEFYLEYYQ